MLMKLNGLYSKEFFRYLLISPFIIIPFLITSKFLDPTLIIKRTSVFILFFIIALIFLVSKIKSNNISKTQFNWIICFVILIGSVFISSYITAVNFSESCWGLVYLVGWFGISLIFLFYANQEITKKLLIITSLVGGVLSFISLLQGYDLFNIPSISSPSATF